MVVEEGTEKLHSVILRCVIIYCLQMEEIMLRDGKCGVGTYIIIGKPSEAR